MMSMSGVRKHFWIEVARGHGACSSPKKYGLNGTIPAIVKRTEGSCGMRLAEGTTTWPRSAKKRVKAALRPLASIAPAYRGQKGVRGGFDSARGHAHDGLVEHDAAGRPEEARV